MRAAESDFLGDRRFCTDFRLCFRPPWGCAAGAGAAGGIPGGPIAFGAPIFGGEAEGIPGSEIELIEGNLSGFKVANAMAPVVTKIIVYIITGYP